MFIWPRNILTYIYINDYMTYVFTKCGNLILGRIPTYVNESEKYVYPSFLVTQTSRAVEGVLHVHVIPLVKNE